MPKERLTGRPTAENTSRTCELPVRTRRSSPAMAPNGPWSHLRARLPKLPANLSFQLVTAFCPQLRLGCSSKVL